jgi:hypothetical protein
LAAVKQNLVRSVPPRPVRAAVWQSMTPPPVPDLTKARTRKLIEASETHLINVRQHSRDSGCCHLASITVQAPLSPAG